MTLATKLIVTIVPKKDSIVASELLVSTSNSDVMALSTAPTAVTREAAVSPVLYSFQVISTNSLNSSN